jgi:hypothetical protein
MHPRCLVVALTTATACTSGARGLHDAPIEVPALPEAAGPPVSLLVCRFEDLRGDRFGRNAPTAAIPVVNFFYTGGTSYYADRSGFLRDKGFKTDVLVGTIENTLPDLVARTIQEKRPAWPIEVTATRERCRGGGDAAFVIDGAIRRTELRTHFNLFPLAVMSLVGTPLAFVDFTGELDIEIRHAGTGAAVWRHTFQIDERRAVGLYYNRHAGYELFAALVRDAVRGAAAGAIHVAERGA